MTTQQVAERLVDLCRTGQWTKAHDELYANHAVSIESPGSNFPERVEGIVAIKQKGDQFDSMVEEMHSLHLDAPVVGGDFFSCNMKLDVTFKGQPRVQNDEICVYKVENGKIVSEQFFY